MNWKQRRYLMSVPAIVFLMMAGAQVQKVADGLTGIGVWIILVSALIAGGASVLAINQYANREVAAISGSQPSGEQ